MKNKILPALWLSLTAAAWILTPALASDQKEAILFYSPTCHDCTEVKETCLPPLLERYKASVKLTRRSISEMDNYEMLFKMSRQRDPSTNTIKVPTLIFGDKMLVGKDDICAKAGELFATGQRPVPAHPLAPGAAPAFDPMAHFKSFTPLAVVGAGLVDGINPCAFTVIIFFISFLALQGYRRRDLAIIGLTFSFAVFVTYLLIGVGLFNFFYVLAGYSWVRKCFNWGIGSVSLVLAFLAGRDAFNYKRTGKSDDMVLSLPQRYKDRIHSLIGKQYRTSRGGLVKKTYLTVIVTALATGFTVSLIEAVCTGQMYLPTIVFVLKSTPLKIAAFGYLALYNLMFITPLLVILFFAVMGASSEQFGALLKKHLFGIKLAMAAMFLFLAVFLLWRG
jgi:glutaredoxin